MHSRLPARGVDFWIREGHSACGCQGVIDVYASRQYGVFNRRQIREAGYDRSAVQRRVSVAGFEVTSMAETLMTLARDLSVSDLEAALLVFDRSAQRGVQQHALLASGAAVGQ